jgi:hypothetical protein
MLQKGCKCREGEMEEWKQNRDDVFLSKVNKEREKEREKRERGKRERGKNKMS